MNAYDEIPYPGRPYPQTHPDRLAAIATLAGMAPAPVERCRVLEVGCGDASNLIPMAHGLPDSEFVGIDLAARPIERGTQLVATLGLRNLALRALDLADFPPDSGQFDYIIAHGLYSWIPAPARDRLLALVTRHLAPQGAAFVSYNTYPGCYVRRMAWEMLRFHTDHLTDPQARIAEAQGLARLLATGRKVYDGSSAALKAEFEQLVERDVAHLFHDDLADVNDPVYFHELIDTAQRHRLQFLGEAELGASGYGGLTLETRQVLGGLDVLTREQYLDFILCRRFRQTLLCHEEVALDRTSGPARISTFLLSVRGRVVATAREPDEVAPEGADGKLAREADVLLEAMLEALDEAAPRRLTFDELAAAVGVSDGGDRGLFRQVVYGAARVGALLLHSAAPRLTTEPGDRPLASAIARQQLATGNVVTTLSHDSVKLDHETARRLLSLLDGTRTRSALVAALGTALEGSTAAERLARLDAHLRHLAKLALLAA